MATTSSPDTPITKRLHISGLLPSISPEDLSKRLSTFGVVKSVDGFGLKDVLGDERKFGYVTIESTVGKLAKCLNLLSGSTWKGAKLRIGEAKPDFRERLEKERQDAATQPPKKRRRFHNVEYAEDMSLVTPSNAHLRSGWKVTPLGRVLRPVKMRPDRPLPPFQGEATTTKVKRKSGSVKKGGDESTAVGVVDGGDGEKKKKRKREKDPDSRARRRTIDMTKWGSVHLKGMFLDLEVVPSARRMEMDAVSDMDMADVEGDESSGSSDSEEDEGVQLDTDVIPRLQDAGPKTISPQAPASAPRIPPTPPPNSNGSTDTLDVAQEKMQTLQLLSSIFGSDDKDWGGEESLGSDVEDAPLGKMPSNVTNLDDVSYEVVPRAKPPRDVDHSEEDDSEPESIVGSPPSKRTQVPKSELPPVKTKLKDLFAPKEAEAGFSLLGHLDLDLELGEDVAFGVAPNDPEISIAEPSSFPPISTTSHRHDIPTSATFFSFTPSASSKQPLFFPLPATSRGGSLKARPRDIFDVAKERGWDWRDPAVAFYRTESEEEIKKGWGESKVELTREWKKRRREAGKISGRRRGGKVDDGDDV